VSTVVSLGCIKTGRFLRTQNDVASSVRIDGSGKAPFHHTAELQDAAHVLARRVPVSAFWRYRVSLQRKKRCQQIIGFNDESFSIAVCWAYRSHGILGTVLIIILILYLLGRL